jgi:hypothetical protein
MTLKCELCGKKFKRLQEAFIHPFSFIRPKIVHRECINRNVMMLIGFGPFLPITTVIEMAVPSIIFLTLMFVVMLSLISISIPFVILGAFFGALIVFRINFLGYLFKAKKQFEE